MTILLPISLVAVLFLSSCATAPVRPPQPLLEARGLGWRVPQLSAQSQEGSTVDLRASTQGEWAAVFFYPDADTPG